MKVTNAESPIVFLEDNIHCYAVKYKATLITSECLLTNSSKMHAVMCELKTIDRSRRRKKEEQEEEEEEEEEKKKNRKEEEEA